MVITLFSTLASNSFSVWSYDPEFRADNKSQSVINRQNYLHFTGSFSLHLTGDEEVSVEFACDTTANVIGVFLVAVELSRVRHVPQATRVVV